MPALSAIPAAAFYASRAVDTVNAVRGIKRTYDDFMGTAGTGNQIFGATYTARNAYRKKRVPRRVARRAKRSFKSHVRNAMRLQRPQFTTQHSRFNGSSGLNNQGWFSLDMLNGGVLRRIVESQLPTGSGPVALRDLELWVQSFSLRYYITNTGTTPLFLDIYKVYPRRTHTAAELDVTTSPSNGNTLASWLITHFTGNVGHDLAADPKGDPVPDWAQLGANPFQWENFCREFKIASVRTNLVNPSATIEQRMSCKPFKLNLARLGEIGPDNSAGTGSNANINNWYFPRISSTLLFRIRGTADGTNESLAASCGVAWEECATTKVLQTKSSSNALFTNGA